MEVEVAVLGFQSIIVLMVFVDVKQHLKKKKKKEGGQSFRSCVKVEVAVLGFQSPNSPYGFRGRKATLNLRRTAELRSCVKVEVVVLGPLIVLLVSVDVKQH